MDNVHENSIMPPLLSRLRQRYTLNLFDDEFSRITIRSEMSRSVILGGYAVMMLFMIAYGYYSNAQLLPDQNRVLAVIRTATGAMLFLLSYEIFLYFLLRHLFHTRRTVPEAPRYFNALVEVSIPTFGLYASSLSMDPPYALQSPAAYTYFIFIILSALRLNWKLSLWTGVVATIEFVTISYFLLGQTENPDSYFPMLVSPVQYLARGANLLLGGAATAFVSFLISKRVRETISYVDERNQIKEMFGQYVSPEVVNRLLEQKELDSEVRHVAILFFDIRNFTTFSESRSPVEVVNFLNTVFEVAVDVVNRNNGIINKFLGDGFMAVFGAPLSNGWDSQNAVKAALEIRDVLEEEQSSGRLQSMNFGIGIHSGEAVTGNVGSKERKEYTIIGDSVNLASRIEQLNKQFHSRILVSENVYGALNSETSSSSSEERPDFSFPDAEFLGDTPIKGKELTVGIYRYA